MNKNIFTMFLTMILLLSAGYATAAVGVGSWTSNDDTASSITTGQSAEFRYGITAVTQYGGKYSIELYREGSSNPIYTYVNNQPTVTNGALGRFNVTASNYGNLAGNYYILLTSVDKYSTDTYKLNLAVIDPIIPLSVSCSANPSSGNSPLSTTLTGTATGGSGTYNYKWTFGDSSSTSSTTTNQMSHVYSDGTFYPTLTVLDSKNNQASANCGAVDSIKVIPQLTATCALSPSSGYSPLSVNIVGGANGGTGTYTYSWNFGDGASVSNSQSSTSHTYSEGTFTAVLTVKDSNNNQASKTCGTVTVTKKISPITGTCTVSPKTGTIPLNAVFNVQATGGTGSYHYQWTLGDGNVNSGTQNAIVYTYTSAGTFNSLVEVFDNSGNYAIINCGTVQTANPIPQLTASCTATKTSGTTPLNTQFNADANGGTGSYIYSWKFGDGNTGNNQPSITHSYNAAGIFYPELTVTDANNKSNSVTANCPNIVATKPVIPITATCSVNPTSGNYPLNVGLSAGTSGGSGKYIYAWTFGDGTIGPNQASINHIYTTDGTYTAKLTVTDSDDANNKYTANCPSITVTVPITPITVSCTASPLTGYAPLDVALSAQATGGTGGYSYKWNFGDSSTTTTTTNKILSYIYQNPGTYSSSVTVTDSSGSQKSAVCGQITVKEKIKQLTASCTANPTSGTVPLTVSFNGMASGGVAPYTYSWRFDDGTTGSNQNALTHTYTTAGTYNPTFKITDSNNNIITADCAAAGIKVTKPTPILDVESITCFPKITDGKNQSCSVYVKSSDGTIPGNVDVTAYYLDGKKFGSCKTDRLSGGCEVENPVYGVGTYTVYATATANGYINDTDKNPTFTFDVYTQRYNVINLDTYRDSNFYYVEHTFYRGQALYAKFQVYDPISNKFMTDDIVTAASLVSLPGGRADLSRMTYSGNWYYYKLDAIPLTHDFLGDSNVFAFAFNFTGLTSGEAQVNLTILNNKPTISNIADVYIKVGESYKVLLNNYGTDLEDKTLDWTSTKDSNAFTSTLGSGNTLSITGTSVGNGTITLKGYDLDKDYASATIKVFVLPNIVEKNLTVSCSATPQNGYNPLNVSGKGTANGGSGTYSYLWSFGDGTAISGNLTNVEHTYNDAGTYSMTLTVTDSDGKAKSANCGIINVEKYVKPKINLTVSCSVNPTSGYAPLTVSIKAGANGVPFYTYYYDFGDGQNVTTYAWVAQYHTYNNTGTYKPKVAITDAEGNTGSADCQEIVVEKYVKPKINLTVSCSVNPTSGYSPLSVTIRAGASNGVPFYMYSYDFGDGQNVTTNAWVPQYHTYNNTGTYKPKVAITDAEGNTGSTECQEIIVEKYVEPKINLTVKCYTNDTRGYAPLDISLRTTVENGTGTYNFTYDDGNGHVTTNHDNLRSYKYNEGLYNPKVTVVDSLGNTGNAQCGQIIVEHKPKIDLTVMCEVNETKGYAPLSVAIRAAASKGTGYYTYTFDYGNGHTSSSGSSNVYQIYSEGTYHPSVSVVDSDGNSGSASCGTIGVYKKPINATIMANIGGPYNGYTSEVLTIDGSASSGPIILYRWNFGDGTSADTTQPTVDHTYGHVNIYNVTLTVFNEYGDSSTASTTAKILDRTNYKPEDNTSSMDKGLFVNHLLVYGEHGDVFKPNDDVNIDINVKNYDKRLDNVRVTIMIPELGVETRSSTFDLSRGEDESKSLILPLEGAAPGVYYVKIIVGNDDVVRTKYREITVRK